MLLLHNLSCIYRVLSAISSPCRFYNRMQESRAILLVQDSISTLDIGRLIMICRGPPSQLSSHLLGNVKPFPQPATLERLWEKSRASRSTPDSSPMRFLVTGIMGRSYEMRSASCGKS